MNSELNKTIKHGGYMSKATNWMEDPELTNIATNKLLFLEKMLFESKNHSGKELMPFFMSLAMKAKKENITFSENEINIIVPVLKKYASEDEIKKMDQVIKMFKTR